MKNNLTVQTTIRAGGKCKRRCMADGYVTGTKDAFGTCTCWGGILPVTHSAGDGHSH